MDLSILTKPELLGMYVLILMGFWQKQMQTYSTWKGLVIGSILLPHVHGYAQIYVRSASVSHILRLCEALQESRDGNPLLSSEHWLTMMRITPQNNFNLHRELHDYRVVSNTSTWLQASHASCDTSVCLYTCASAMAFQRFSGAAGLHFDCLVCAWGCWLFLARKASR